MSEPGGRAADATPESRVPAWVLGFALFLWGWSADSLALAFPLLVLALTPRVLRRRFDLTPTEFHRALDVCWVLLLGGMLLVYSREPMGSVLRSFARWLPVVVFPAFMAQVWSIRGRLPVHSLIPLPGWRRQVDPRTAFDISPMFVVVCLLSASVAGPSMSWFYAGVLVVAGAGLWSVRVRSVRAGSAAVFLGLAAAGGWFASEGIGSVQQWLEGKVLFWVTRLRGDDRSDRVARTSIGRRGEIGGSSRVVMRVHSLGQAPVPRRLRVAAFSAWRSGNVWFAPHGETVKVEGVGDEYRLDPRPGREGAAYIELVPSLTGRFLALPASTRSLADLVANRIERTPLGAVRAEITAGMISYRADYGTDSNWEAPPLDEDLHGVPESELPAIQSVVEGLELAGREPEEVLKWVDEFFSKGFRYTTSLVDEPLNDSRALTPVARFLLGTKAGHCEYFATAAVLMLRNAGIPARYATGYLVSSGERDGEVVTVRERQAHAWVRAWIHDQWRDFDPTPSADLDVEMAGLGWRGRLQRAWNDLRFSISHWWWLGEKRLLRQAYWLALPLLAGLIWRLRRVREAAQAKLVRAAAPHVTWPGEDSEWFAVERFLAGRGWDRVTGETSRHWSGRLEREGWPVESVALASGARALHERLRFDPQGLDPADRDRLRRSSGELLAWGEAFRGENGAAD